MYTPHGAHHSHYQTPYVTPYILNPASQVHDQFENNCKSLQFHSRSDAADCGHAFALPSPVMGKEIEYFSEAGFDMSKIHIRRNAPVAQLYEDAVRNEGAIISSTGALINFSGKKTGRSPKDKRIVFEETSKDEIWWGPVNIKMDERECFFILSACVKCRRVDLLF